MNLRFVIAHVAGFIWSAMETSDGRVSSICVVFAIRLCAGRKVIVIAVVVETMLLSGVKVMPVKLPVVAVYVIPVVIWPIKNCEESFT